MSARSRITLLLVVVATLTGLTGCVPTGPTPSATPTATTSPTPSASATPSVTATPTPVAPVATTLEVSATGIKVLDASSSVIIDIPFTTNGDTAAAQLETALGVSPALNSVAQSNCRRPGNIYDFGGFELDGAGTITTASPAVFSVIVRAATTSNGVFVRGPGGVQIGGSEADVLAANPGSVVSSSPGLDTYFNLQATPGSAIDGSGVLGIGRGGALAVMEAPVFIFGDC
jgi:hypothetical protein